MMTPMAALHSYTVRQLGPVFWPFCPDCLVPVWVRGSSVGLCPCCQRCQPVANCPQQLIEGVY